MFEAWLSECRSILSATLHLTETKAAAMIQGAGIAVYLAKFQRGFTPQQCVDDELVCWNE
jgi:hypothetical protein